MAFIRTTAAVLMISLQIALLAQARSNSNVESSTRTTTFVDNELCESNGLFCGRDSRPLRMTRCCEHRNTGTFLRYSCCNPELTGVIVGVVIGAVLLIACCAVFWIVCFVSCFVICKKSSGVSGRSIFKTRKPHHAATESLSYNDVFQHTSFLRQNGGNVGDSHSKPSEQLPSYHDIHKDTATPEGHGQSQLATNMEKETEWTDELLKEEKTDIQCNWKTTTDV